MLYVASLFVGIDEELIGICSVKFQNGFCNKQQWDLAHWSELSQTLQKTRETRNVQSLGYFSAFICTM